ncbi:MAG: dihydroorotase family protein [Candidatus Daviesbacteria bacterium]|nr:dihydroorotase family protein [Candidatus Daviesbacteria bacterium]
MITLPGLIDTHVHLREPGATQKEDFETGTKAAIAGGYTCILDMPNNPEPTITPEALDKKISLAEERIYCDVGFHFGATLDSTQHFKQAKDKQSLSLRDKIFGLKVYMNHTTGTLLQEDPQILQTIFESWPKDKVLMVHAEGPTLEKAIQLAKNNGNRLHVCHVSLAQEVTMIKKAKSDGLPITCEVTCHHLFLTDEDAKKLGPFGMMRPPLPNKEDQQALWNGISDGTVDTIASDHAPHTKEEKNPPAGGSIPNGIPGLETTLPLLLTAVNEGKITVEKVIELTNTNVRKIFNVPQQFDTVVEVDPTKHYTLDARRLYTKCGWTPFEEMKVTGKIKRVVLRGQVVFENTEIVNPPKGNVIYPEKIKQQPD